MLAAEFSSLSGIFSQLGCSPTCALQKLLELWELPESGNSKFAGTGIELEWRLADFSRARSGEVSKMAKLAWQSAGLTSRGLVRKDNQDNYFISKDGRVFVVADGVGGYGGGETASRIAVETVEERWSLGVELESNDLEAWMRETAHEANRRIIDAAQKDVALENMGTTIVIVVVDKDGELHIGHAGDSRAVRVRNDEFKMLTIDHSMVMEMHMKGQLTLEQCRTNIYKHLITRCLGHDDPVEIDYSRFDFLPGDCVVLASDGLADEIPEDEICRLVQECADPGAVCKTLMDTVLERGAHDNTTIVAVVRSPKVVHTTS